MRVPKRRLQFIHKLEALSRVEAEDRRLLTYFTEQGPSKASESKACTPWRGGQKGASKAHPRTPIRPVAAQRMRRASAATDQQPDSLSLPTQTDKPRVAHCENTGLVDGA